MAGSRPAGFASRLSISRPHLLGWGSRRAGLVGWGKGKVRGQGGGQGGGLAPSGARGPGPDLGRGACVNMPDSALGVGRDLVRVWDRARRLRPEASLLLR